MRKRAWSIAGLAIGGGAMGLAVATTTGPEVAGCTTHQCDQLTYDWPPKLDGGSGGFMVGKDLYVSNDLNQTWLTYNGNTTIKVWFPPEVAGRIAEIPRVFVGIDDSPNTAAAFDAGANYTQAVGQLAIFNVLNVYPRDPADGGPVYPRNPADGGPGGSPLNSGQPVGGGVEITNSSCATYFAHIEVAFLPEESALASNPAVLPPGAGGPADGGFEASD